MSQTSVKIFLILPNFLTSFGNSWKVSVFGVFLVLFFPTFAFELNTERYGVIRIRMQSECRKIRPWKTQKTDTFYAVKIFYSRDQFRFCLWRMNPVLKHSKLPKYYGQSCWWGCSQLTFIFQIIFAIENRCNFLEVNVVHDSFDILTSKYWQRKMEYSIEQVN